MTNYSCDCRGVRVGGVVTVSIILGILAAFLRFTATITVGTTFLWAVFAAAVAYLGVTLLVTGLSACCSLLAQCDCPLLTTQLVGNLGSILLANILLAVTLATTSILGAILFGILIGFFALTLLSTAALARNLSRCEN